MAQLNGKKPFVGVKYIQKATGTVYVVDFVTVGNVRIVSDDADKFEQYTSLAGFYDNFRRAPNQPAAKVRNAKVEAVANPRVKQSEFEND